MTAHNQRLSTTRSIPWRTMSVFSSTVTNDEEFLLIPSTALIDICLTSAIWRISHCFLYRPARIHGNPYKWFVVSKTCLLKRRLLDNRGSIVCVTSRMCLTKRCLAMYCSSWLSRKHALTSRCLAMELFRHNIFSDQKICISVFQLSDCTDSTLPVISVALLKISQPFAANLGHVSTLQVMHAARRHC
jgi:hypothetical protein